MKKIAVFDPWPNETSAEKEFLARLSHCIKQNGGELLVLSPESRDIPADLEMVLHLDPSNSSPIPGVKNYLLLWIPPSFIVHTQYMEFHFNMGLFDKIFSIWPSRLSAHADIFLLPFKKSVEKCLVAPSVPKDFTLEPFDFRTQSASIFYAGVNSERIQWKHGRKVLANHGRFFELFKELDLSVPIRFFGPSKFGGLPTWDGFTKYCGSIPFDGKSIINEIHQCGIVLVIHSEAHKTYNMPTNRLFEACAGGAIAIADRLDFIVENFGDSVLYIDPSSSISLAQQIQLHLDWIKKNPEAAYNKALKAQNIFTEQFSLDKTLEAIIDSHTLSEMESQESPKKAAPKSRIAAICFETDSTLYDIPTHLEENIDYHIFAAPLNRNSRPNIFYHPRENFFDKEFRASLTSQYSHFSFFSSIERRTGSAEILLSKLDSNPLTTFINPYFTERSTIRGSKVAFNTKDIVPALPSPDLRLFISNTYPWNELQQSPLAQFPISSFIFPTALLNCDKIDLLRTFDITDSIALAFLVECLARKMPIQNSFCPPIWSGSSSPNLRRLAEESRVIYDLFLYDYRLSSETLNALGATITIDASNDSAIFWRLLKAFLIDKNIAKYLRPMHWLYKKIK